MLGLWFSACYHEGPEVDLIALGDIRSGVIHHMNVPGAACWSLSGDS